MLAADIVNGRFFSRPVTREFARVQQNLCYERSQREIGRSGKGSSRPMLLQHSLGNGLFEIGRSPKYY